MKFRSSPVWWPLLEITSLIFIPYKRFKRAQIENHRMNQKRIAKAQSIKLPEVDFLELLVLVE